MQSCQKGATHRPHTKVLEFLLALLGGLPHLTDLSTAAHPIHSVLPTGMGALRDACDQLDHAPAMFGCYFIVGSYRADRQRGVVVAHAVWR